MASLRASLALAALVSLLALSAAEVVCKGMLNSPKVITTDVKVEGSSCVLQNVNITGSVTVLKSGSLTTMGKVNVFGCVHAFKPQSLNLGGKLRVNGGLSVMDSSAAVLVGLQAYVGTVSITNVNNFIAQGAMTSLSVAESGSVALYGASVLGGGVFRRGGNGNTEFCGANIKGGVSLSGVNGNLQAVASISCGQTSITGTVSATKGSGNVHIAGGKLFASDFIVKEQKGDVSVMNAIVSDVSIDKLTGSVLLQDVQADSDAGFFGVTGTVTVRGSKFDGDLNVGSNNAVRLESNNFGLEVVTVSGNKGLVSVTGNTDFSISLTENNGVEFNNNDVRFAEINKNKNTVMINGNTAQSLSCSENNPAPIGSGNKISIPSPGQCAKFK